MVNAHHVKNVAGRKSDVSDVRWLQHLHTFGLLRASFQPDKLTRSRRNHVRQRKSIVQQMNIKLNNVIRDLNGTTGTKIITAILEGERDPKKLAQHRDHRIKASEQTLIKSIEGNSREEQVFNLQLAYDHYIFLQMQLKQCDAESEKIIEKMTSGNSPKSRTKKVQKSKNNPDFDVAQYLHAALGVDVTQI